MSALRAEWGRTWSVRAPAACLLGALVLTCATAWTLANDTRLAVARGELTAGTTVAPVDAVLPALQSGLLLVAAFAMVTITSEHASGSLRSTLQAEPRRGRVLVAKTVVVAGVAGAVGALVVVASDLLVRLQLAELVEPGGAGTAELGVRGAVVVLLDAVLVVGLAALVRYSVGTLAVCFVVFVAMLALPPAVAAWTPAAAGGAFLAGDATDHPPLVSLLVLAAWAGATWAAGLVVLDRRDA